MVYLLKKQQPSRCWLKETLFLNNIKIHSNNNNVSVAVLIMTGELL